MPGVPRHEATWSVSKDKARDLVNVHLESAVVQDVKLLAKQP